MTIDITVLIFLLLIAPNIVLVSIALLTTTPNAIKKSWEQFGWKEYKEKCWNCAGDIDESLEDKMKFRNKETGKVYDTSKGNFVSGFCNGRSCVMCPIYPIGTPRCTKWVNEHPNEAAELMGYEIVEETMKPRICEAFGVEVFEKFKIPGR